jgi:hypothetical protein
VQGSLAPLRRALVSIASVGWKKGVGIIFATRKSAGERSDAPAREPLRAIHVSVDATADRWSDWKIPTKAH